MSEIKSKGSYDTSRESVPDGNNGTKWVLGYPLQVTTYDDFIKTAQKLSHLNHATVVDFTNTQIVTMRRFEDAFKKTTSVVDYYIPDGMPLIWCLNLQGCALTDRVYGPTFMRKCVPACPAPFTHYFLGGSEECRTRLIQAFHELTPNLKMAGSHNGYFRLSHDSAEENQIVEEINRLSPDFIWIGLGTPKQQEWIFRRKHQIRRGLILLVGFAFDVNAGTKPDQPLWIQKRGLGWLFRLVSEPRRLALRYFKYNSLFLFFLMWDILRGQAFKPVDQIKVS